MLSKQKLKEIKAVVYIGELKNDNILESQITVTDEKEYYVLRVQDITFSTAEKILKITGEGLCYSEFKREYSNSKKVNIKIVCTKEIINKILNNSGDEEYEKIKGLIQGDELWKQVEEFGEKNLTKEESKQ